jgi:hypothetical protein
MKPIKIWPHLTIVTILCAVLGGAAAAFWVRYEQTAEAQALPGAARIERVDGQVALNRSLDANGSNTQWDEATANTPVSVGDRIYTRDNSRAAIAFTGRNFARLNADSSLDVLTLSDQRTQLALRDGSALFDVGSLESGQLFEVATPCGAVDLNQPGLYQVALDDNGNAIATVLSGLAQVIGQGGTGRIEKGEVLTVPCQAASQAVVSSVEPRYAGTVIDDYYTYRYPRLYDHRYRDYDTYLNDPYYYDPYRRYVSYQYVTDIIPGIYDLDNYGDWQDVSGYGYCWHPRVDAGWAPYQSGYWTTDYPYGLTWISNEPWGYAPYHYGRWSYFSNQWFWVPERVRTRPVYSPALVAFVPVTQTNEIGWVPLGPGDPYAPRYYGPNWQPHYLNPTRVEERIVNLNVPGAVTVVQTQDFNRVIDRRIITRVDRPMLDHARPVLDPFTVDSLRQTALRNREARHRVDVPQDVAQRLYNTRVVTSRAPVAPPFRKDLAQALRAESIPEKARTQKLEFKDNRHTAAAPGVEQARQPVAGQASGQSSPSSTMATDQARERQMATLAAEAARGGRGSRDARRQMQQLEREQKQQLQQQRAERTRAQQAQGERVGQPAQQQAQREQIEAARQQQQAQKEAARQQAIAAQQQRRNAAQQQVESRRQQSRQQIEAQQNMRRRANQQAATERAQQEAARRAQQRQAGPQPPPPPGEQRPQARFKQPQVQQQVIQQQRQQAAQQQGRQAVPQQQRQQQQARRQAVQQQMRQKREQRPQVQMRQQQPRPQQTTERKQALPQQQKAQPASAQPATPQPQADRAKDKDRGHP